MNTHHNTSELRVLVEAMRVNNAAVGNFKVASGASVES